MQPQTNYPLGKLMHDVYTDKALAAEYRRDRNAVMSHYDLSEEIIAALLRDDVEQLAPLVNGFLLRYYCVVIGMSDPEFIGRIRNLRRG
jgi:hypothetical protein